MSKCPEVTINGNYLTIEDIVFTGCGRKKVVLDPSALGRCRASREYLEKALAKKQIIYGVNTSFGPMCSKIIEESEINALQVNLIKSHAAGLGDPIKSEIALSILTVRLNTLAKGFSGVRVELLEFMRDMINNGVAPYIPEYGSVGASGDLIHLSHMALAIIGEGRVFYQDDLLPAGEIFAKLGMVPPKLTMKEGIALVNGTSAMTALAAFALYEFRKLFNLSCVTGAFALEIFGGIDDAFDEDLHALKPHPGQLMVNDTLRKLYRGSGNITPRQNVNNRIQEEGVNGKVFESKVNVQDVYSIRCIPQILAPVAEALESAERTIFIEANSSNDNPIVVPESGKILHCGNFHGQSISFAMDAVCIAISTLSNLSERRINKLLDKNLNDGLPEQLIPGQVGLTMGFMGAQYLATSSTAEIRQLANPVSVNSISCNASNQDVVSMGTVAARKALRSVRIAKHVLTLEVLTDLQALSFRNSAALGYGTKRIYQMLSREFEVYDNTRVFHEDLVKFLDLLFSGEHFDDLSPFLR